MLLLALFKRDSLAFFLANVIRILGVVVMLLIISAEITSMVNNIKGFTEASHTSLSQARSIVSSNLPSETTLSSTKSASLTVSSSVSSTSIDAETSSTKRTSALTSSKTTASASASVTSTQNLEKRYILIHNKRNLQSEIHSPSFINQLNRLIIPEILVTQNSTTTKDCGYFDLTNVPQQTGGILFACLQTVLNVILFMFLILSEVPLPVIAQFYVNWFPPLGPDHGVGWLGALMVYVCTSILSKRCSTFSLVTAWMAFVLGCLNVICGLFFGKSIRERRSLFSFLPKPLQRKIQPSNGSTFARPSVHFDDASRTSSSRYTRKIIEIGRPAPIPNDPLPPYPNSVKSRSGSSR